MVYDECEVSPPKSKKVIIAELQEQVKKLETEEKNKQASVDSYYKTQQELRAEIEQMHCLFDTLEGCAGRKSNHEDSWSRTDFSLATRFSSWLAFKLTK